ncbi:hypothetical protein JW805_11630 [Roseomonas aeriglobus]|nr:hypothetical protein [Roseomonas aeriglobus]
MNQPGVAISPFGTDAEAIAAPPHWLTAYLYRHPIFCVWSAWSLVLLIASVTAIAEFRTQDPDDFLRLMEVRDLLAGQSWFDVTQYRMNPPVGAQMHWSRLVDIPIALALILGRLVLAEPAASKFAMVIVPLGQLALIMSLVWRVMKALDTDYRHRVIAIAIVPLSPLLLSCFLPMRIDHHGWQVIATFATVLFFLRRRGPRDAGLAGICAALGLSISLEGLPVVALLAGLYGLRSILFGERGIAWFLTGLATASWVSHLATRPSSELLPHCDSVGWPHLAAFSVAAILTQAAMRCPGTDRQRGFVVRAGLLALIGGIAGAIIIGPIGVCAVNPFATIDPLMKRYWHGVIMEGLPLTSQITSVRVVLLWTPLIVLAAWLSGLPDRDRPLHDRTWVWLAMFTLGASFVSMLVMRQGTVAGICTTPFSALLIARWLPRARAIGRVVPRIAMTLAVPLLATPTLASALAKSADESFFHNARTDFEPFGQKLRPNETECDLQRLASLPSAHLFATLDIGPELLARTNHTVITSGYHRNMAKMREVVEAFSGDPAHAQAIVRANRATHVLLCLTAGDTAVFRARRPDNLANQLRAGHTPGWLQPVPGYHDGMLRLYRVR